MWEGFVPQMSPLVEFAYCIEFTHIAVGNHFKTKLENSEMDEVSPDWAEIVLKA